MDASPSDGAPRSARLPAACALLALLLGGLGPAAAESSIPLYVATWVELTVDGQPADSARVDGAFGEALVAEGFNRVTAAAAGITDAASAEQGAGFPAADLTVITRIDSRALAAGIRGTSLVRYEASASARVLATETGEVLGTLTAEGPGIDVDAASAARIAAAHAARTLAGRLSEKLPALAAAPSAIELRITGLPDRAEVDRVVEALGAPAGVDGVRIVSREGRGAASQTTLRLAVRALSAAQLARFVEEAGGLGLRVESHTLRRVQAAFDPMRRYRLSLAVAPLRNRTGESAEDALLAPLTRVLRTALGAQAGVGLAEQQAPLTVHGALSYVGRTEVAIALELKDPSGRVVARTRVVGPGERFSRTVRKAARALTTTALARVREDAGLRRLASLPVRLPKPAEPPPAAIAAVEAPPGIVGTPLQLVVQLARDPGAARLEVRSGEQVWAERSAARSADGLTRVFEGPSPTAPGAVDVVATLRARHAGHWQTERHAATALVRPELVARWSATPAEGGAP